MLSERCGDGSGGACIHGVLDAYAQSREKNDASIPNVLTSRRRFLKSSMGRALTKDECGERGRVVATEINGLADTIGSQFLITIDEGADRALDGFRSNANSTSTDGTREESSSQNFYSLGKVVEDDNEVLKKLNDVYCDKNGRPYADIRVIRALVVDDPFDGMEGMKQLLEDRGVKFASVGDDETGKNHYGDATDRSSSRRRVLDSPNYDRPFEEKVEIRISAAEIDEGDDINDDDLKKIRLRQEERLKRGDKSRAVVLEMLGDLPSADITAPENVLFVCKLNPVTEDEDLELIFSRFDEKVSVDIVRDHKTGASLQYAFVEFTSKDQATEAYFKMNNALVDDRRIKVDFSQSVSKVWDRFNQRDRKQSQNYAMPSDPFKEQMQKSNRKHSSGNRERNNNTSRDRIRDTNRNSKDNLYSNHRNIGRDDQYYDRYRSADNDKKHSSRKREREIPGGRHRQHYRLSEGYDDHRDQYVQAQKRHHGGRDHYNSPSRVESRRAGADEYSRSKHHTNHRNERMRDESSTRTNERGNRYDSGFEDYSESDRSERNYARKHRRNSEDRHRRRRSSSRSSDESSVKRRERHRSSRKKQKKKRDRRRDDDKRHNKRSRRDEKHHSHRKDFEDARRKERRAR